MDSHMFCQQCSVFVAAFNIIVTIFQAIIYVKYFRNKQKADVYAPFFTIRFLELNSIQIIHPFALLSLFRSWILFRKMNLIAQENNA